ncbi:GH32 C-terminal domain-containing protein [Neobacillus niacini]|uniref:glycoside hydrolase family 32 protein n=1 Tax=Neobacillus niacini TaxID=86668 RepID=UPI0021CB3233|nr:GH32 C-terminal domain-containing protein [Neobacillus niacini]MCM3763840.1 GH32 C-terminal domain-containing protein [Neobacillus niacini]
MNRLQKANEYIQQNKAKVTSRPYYHFSPEIGWMNDPNGFIFYQGYYHLFYQYNPYDVVWDSMHWGHAKTKDFVNWEYLPVALANDKAYDTHGCFSGSAIEKDGKLYLIYTGHIDPNIGFDRDEAEISERQCVAYSSDGVHFEKYPLNPAIGEKQLPEGYLICDFRDPKVLEVAGTYYCVLSVRNVERRGEIIMFKSKDLLDWEFHSSIFQTKFEDNTLLECPDLFEMDGKYVLLFSEMPCDPEFSEQIQNKTSYVIGEMDFEKGVFKPEKKGLLDHGQTFYAPQSTEGQNGERLLISWMHRWHQTTPPREYGFNGMMSIPRQLTIKNGDLHQRPFIDRGSNFALSALYENVVVEEQLEIVGKEAGYLKVALADDAQKFTIELNKNEANSTRVEVDSANNKLVILSDYGSREPIVVEDCFGASGSEKTLEFYLDLHSVELFVNSGEKVVSFTAYDQNKGTDISIAGSGTVLEEVRYETFRG